MQCMNCKHITTTKHAMAHLKTKLALKKLCTTTELIALYNSNLIEDWTTKCSTKGWLYENDIPENDRIAFKFQ